MTANDARFGKDTDGNCRGCFSQGLIALRTTLWMDYYGKGEEFDVLAKKRLEAWSECFEDMKLGQEA